MRVTVLGSGTSSGVPTLGCKCDVCTSKNPRNKRMRSSIHIDGGGRSILVDCGTDFRTQALANGIGDVDLVLITHTHADHIGGLDDLRAFNMVHRHPIDVYGRPESLAEIRVRFAYCFRPAPPGGGIPDLNLIELPEILEVGELEIQPVPVLHGQMNMVGYRMGAFGYLTDVSSVPESSVEMLKGVEVLITSALRRRPHPTHMSLSEAVDFAQRIGARQTYFIHMCHDLEHEATNAALLPGMELAYDGLVFEV